jgi:hypothetical protein
VDPYQEMLNLCGMTIAALYYDEKNSPVQRYHNLNQSKRKFKINFKGTRLKLSKIFSSITKLFSSITQVCFLR